MKKGSAKAGGYATLKEGITVCCDFYPAGTIVEIKKIHDGAPKPVLIELYQGGSRQWVSEDALTGLLRAKRQTNALAEKLFKKSTIRRLGKFE